MIVPMKKVTIACLTQDRQATVRELQRLGTMHVVPMAPPASEALDALRKQQDTLSKVLNRMRTLLSEGGLTPLPDNSSAVDCDAVLQEFQVLMEEARKNGDELSQVRKAQEQLAPWGSFSRQQLEALEAHGLYAALCAASASRKIGRASCRERV